LTIDSRPPRTQCRKLEYALSGGLRKMAISLASGMERFMRVGALACVLTLLTVEGCGTQRTSA
jgi:hypothetical protein